MFEAILMQDADLDEMVNYIQIELVKSGHPLTFKGTMSEGLYWFIKTISDYDRQYIQSYLMEELQKKPQSATLIRLFDIPNTGKFVYWGEIERICIIPFKANRMCPDELTKSGPVSCTLKVTGKMSITELEYTQEILIIEHVELDAP